MQTTENKMTDEQGAAQEAMPTIRQKIGSTTYIVKSYFSDTATETMEDKIRRMMRHDIESGNY